MCGRETRWWDEQIKDKINTKQKMYKKVDIRRKCLMSMKNCVKRLNSD